MSATDLTLSEIRDRAYQELRTVSTSEAYDSDYMDELINDGYEYVFNRLSNYLGEGSAEFRIIPDASLSTAVTPSDTTIGITDSLGLAAAGVVVIGQDVITYTGNTGTQLTGCTGVNHSITTDVPVRPTYLLATLAPDMDESQLSPINVAGQPYDYLPPHEFFDKNFDVVWKFTILNGRLIFPENTEAMNGQFIYQKKATRMTLDADTPSLIPNNFRVPLLMSYAVGHALIADDERVGWDKYFNYNSNNPGRSSGLFFDNFKALKARYNKRVIPNRKFAGSIFD
jgi:hypothetical protein